jgi:hypothetical protein
MALPRERHAVVSATTAVRASLMGAVPVAAQAEPVARYQAALDDAFYVGVSDEAARLVEYLASFPAPVSAPRPEPQAQPVGGCGGGIHSDAGGPLTYDQLLRLARCESGLGPNDPSPFRTGWFGIESGSAMGYMSWDEQVAWVQRIYAQYGASAWGCGGVL